MEKMNLIKPETLRDLLFKKFEEVQTVNQEESDPLTKGEFDVIKELSAAHPEAIKAKEKIDIIIDKCGLPTRGVGIQNLRECIMETKWKFDVSPEERQQAYKIMIINFIERYFYLICYCMYSMELHLVDIRHISMTGWRKRKNYAPWPQKERTSLSGAELWMLTSLNN